MCSSPKIPKAPPPPQPTYAPPPPTETAKIAQNKAISTRSKGRKRGMSSLTVRRSAVNTGSAGSGANMNS